MPQFPETGKIPDAFFKASVFPYCGHRRPEVLVPPQYGVDTSIVQLPGGLEMALTSDPLSLIPSLGLRESAWLSVHLMANDMATTGRAPQYAQFVLNLPPTLAAADFGVYWQYIHQYCAAMGTAITGGHTGRFEGQQSTVAGGGTMITVAPQGVLLTSRGARAGDVIVVTREAALVATSILALSFPETVRHRCGSEVQQAAAALFYETSALPAALAAAAVSRDGVKVVTAMHDVTEGGLLGAIIEMAQASGCGAVVEEDLLPVGEPQRQVCALFGIDPLFCVGAGSMIMAAREEGVQDLLGALAAAGCRATVAGRFTAMEEGLRTRGAGGDKPLQHPGTDPYWAAFYDALARGLK